MKRNAYMIGLTALAAILLTSCVKDELYNTPHPDKGAVVVATDWSGRSGETDIPQAYTLRIDDKEQPASGETNIVSQLLTPGQYTLAAYNTPKQIAVSGNMASVNGTLAGHIAPTPGYLFASVQEIMVQADDTLYVTVPMKQLVRRLDLELTATEGDYARVRSATATLLGVASTVDIATGERNAAAQTTDTFTQEGGKFTLFFRLLGIIPSEPQTLTVDITFTNGDTQRIVSDLTDGLKDFNSGVEPLKLTGSLRLPVEAGFTGSIEGWQQADGGNTDAH